MVYRIYVEKKAGLDNEARGLQNDIRSFLQIASLERVRVLNRYDVENMEESLFARSVQTVFSEPQLDETYTVLDTADADFVLAVEYLPGQFDQRADSAAQCIQIISQQERPSVRTAKVYLLYGDLTEREKQTIRSYLINPVESREASLEKPATLTVQYAEPADVAVLDGFRQKSEDELARMLGEYGLAMDGNDLRFCQEYFRQEGRDPTITELRMIDTYWSDHCRHTTFNTIIDRASFEDAGLQAAYDEYLAVRRSLNRTKPITLMDIGTIAAKKLRKDGKLERLDESEEINACTVKITVDVDGEAQDWLLLFKNETHNHPTEIEPFGGAATCVGGAIRDPLSGRSYVYAAMRVTGAADPLRPVSETLPGKLPQRKLVTTAAAGYSSYGNQIGLATGQVDELYHDGYAAKHMEIGAVLGAAPAENVRRECPVEGDVVILLGGRTGRDGIGGATGSSKSHTLASLESCGAEVQKGNAPEERKLQRLFRTKEATELIKRCNDFGAGGVSVAIGELADGLDVNLDAVPKKYEGLDGTELAISESQERMAVVVAAQDAEKFSRLAAMENIEATVVATVTELPRLVLRWRGRKIVDVARSFLDSNGAERHASAETAAPQSFEKKPVESFTAGMKAVADDLNVCSKRGLSERFDSTIGAGTVLMPFGGVRQQTPIQAMVHKIPVLHGTTDTCSYMAWGYNPFITERSPYHGAYLAVVESVAKLVATGADPKGDIYLSFQEYFEKLGNDSRKWGKPMAALLGAMKAQLDLGFAAIGGKDSMSGSFEQIHVPPTLVSFAVTTGKTSEVVSPEFKHAGSPVVWLRPQYTADGLPEITSLQAVMAQVHALMAAGKVRAAYTPTYGGVAEAVLKMALGNELGFAFAEGVSQDAVFGYAYGSFLLELSEDVEGLTLLGHTTAEKTLRFGEEVLSLSALQGIYEDKLESVYPCNIVQEQKEIPTFRYTAQSYGKPKTSVAKPLVLIPVFPGTNCEFDSARAVEQAGGQAEIVVIRNLTPQAIAEATDYFARRLRQAQIVLLPGGFSGGDEPDGSGKFITSFFRNGKVKDGVHELLEQRDGLMCGICNGFQALIKLGLVPYGEIRDTDAGCPTLSFNTIARHQSRIVRTRIASNKSPWLMETQPGEVYLVPISHGEGRFLASEAEILRLAENGQIATQYADLSGQPTGDIHFNPNNSLYAVEGITSPDGRVLGKMGHSERIGAGLYQNVAGNYDMGLFRSAVKYFK